jgi:hypothetical protein
MHRVIAILMVAVPVSVAAESSSPYEPLAYLVGHCWVGQLPGKQDRDTHCFSYVYGNRFVRDVHVVSGAGHADHRGESIYFWDGTSRSLRYLYIESDGGSSFGSVEVNGDTLVFPATDIREDCLAATYRSQWKRRGADGYDVLTEFKRGEAWTTGWTMRMTQVVGPGG